MNDSTLVCVFQCIRDLPGDANSLINGNRPSFDSVSERRPFDQLHDQGVSVVGVFESVNRSDVRVIERGEDFGFALKPGHSFSIACERFREDLDCYIAA